jgi:bifunctional DNA-binding transcriptional regulator/antitoxin component of YhaV-PrlF toxin-antitoxin module
MGLMSTRGRVTISKEIRERLGIKPKWLAFQRLVGDHVEIFFVPPEHNKSLMGCTAEYTNVGFEIEEELNQAKERAMERIDQEESQKQK